VSAVLVLFLVLDAGMKIVSAAPSIEFTVRLGFTPTQVPVIGALLAAGTALYLIPPTAVIGAIFLSAYLGGAVATQMRMNDGWFPILFPIVLAVLAWVGLALRDASVRALLLGTSTRA
jgi:hypothetical protein